MLLQFHLRSWRALANREGSIVRHGALSDTGVTRVRQNLPDMGAKIADGGQQPGTSRRVTGRMATKIAENLGSFTD